VERLLNFQREHIRTERRLGVKMLDILFSILTLVLFGIGLKILHYYWIDNFFKLGKDKNYSNVLLWIPGSLVGVGFLFCSFILLQHTLDNILS
jgi:apolipoprotein N-acyltransferase